MEVDDQNNGSGKREAQNKGEKHGNLNLNMDLQDNIFDDNNSQTNAQIISSMICDNEIGDTEITNNDSESDIEMQIESLHNDNEGSGIETGHSKLNPDGIIFCPPKRFNNITIANNYPKDLNFVYANLQGMLESCHFDEFTNELNRTKMCTFVL